MITYPKMIKQQYYYMNYVIAYMMILYIKLKEIKVKYLLNRLHF